MGRPRIRVVMDICDPHRGKVFIDDKEMLGIRRVELVNDASELPVIRFEYHAFDAVYETSGVPNLPEPFTEWYQLKPEYQASGAD